MENTSLHPSGVTIHPPNPPFCCPSTTTLLTRNPAFSALSTSLLKTHILPLRHPTESDITNLVTIDHIVHIFASSTSPNLQEAFSTRRYFVYESESTQYREVIGNFAGGCMFDDEQQEMAASFQLWVECAMHMRAYQVLRFDTIEKKQDVHKKESQVSEKVEDLREREQVIEGLGLKKVELTPRKVSKGEEVDFLEEGQLWVGIDG